MRRSAFNAIGGFEESFRGLVDDLVFFAKFSLHYSVYVSDECWDRYRQHAESDTALAEAQGRGRSAQRTYLSWLERYIEQEGVRDESVHRAVRGALRRSDRRTGSLALATRPVIQACGALALRILSTPGEAGS